jgi:hypothetical protein
MSLRFEIRGGIIELSGFWTIMSEMGVTVAEWLNGLLIGIESDGVGTMRGDDDVGRLKRVLLELTALKGKLKVLDVRISTLLDFTKHVHCQNQRGQTSMSYNWIC